MGTKVGIIYKTCQMNITHKFSKHKTQRHLAVTILLVYTIEFSNFTRSDFQDKSRRMRWVGHVACMGEERKVYKVLVGKPEGKRPLGRPRRRWKDGIRMDLRETGLGGRLL
jgi:hypothetical protein